jgi:integrase
MVPDPRLSALHAENQHLRAQLAAAQDALKLAACQAEAMRGLVGMLGTLSARTPSEPPVNTGFISLTRPGDGARPEPMLRLSPVEGSARIADLVEAFMDDKTLGGNATGYIKGQRKELLNIAFSNNWQRASDITVDSCRLWMHRLHTEGKKSKTVKNYRDTLSRFCDYLVKRGSLSENPVLSLPVPKVIKSRARIVPTDDEVRRIILAALAEWRTLDLAYALDLMVVSGLRASEVYGLRPAMIPDDPAQNWIDLPGWLTKCKREERAYVTLQCHANLRALKAEAIAASRERLFRTGLKRGQVKTYADKARPPVPTRLGDQTLSYHSFRHFAADRLGRLGFSMDEARWAMRHTPQGLTATVYNFSLHQQVADSYRRIPPICNELRFTHGKSGPKALVGLEFSGPLDDTLGAEVEVRMPKSYPHNTTTNGPLAGGTSPSASAIDLGIPERAVGCRVTGRSAVGSASALGAEGRLFDPGRPDLVLAPERTGSLVQISRPRSADEPGPVAPSGPTHSKEADNDQRRPHAPRGTDLRPLCADVPGSPLGHQDGGRQVLLPDVLQGSGEGPAAPGRLCNPQAGQVGPDQGARAHQLAGAAGGDRSPGRLHPVREGGSGGRPPRGPGEPAGGRGMALPFLPHEAAPQAPFPSLITPATPDSLPAVAHEHSAPFTPQGTLSAGVGAGESRASRAGYVNDRHPSTATTAYDPAVAHPLPAGPQAPEAGSNHTPHPSSAQEAGGISPGARTDCAREDRPLALYPVGAAAPLTQRMESPCHSQTASSTTFSTSQLAPEAGAKTRSSSDPRTTRTPGPTDSPCAPPARTSGCASPHADDSTPSLNFGRTPDRDAVARPASETHARLDLDAAQLAHDVTETHRRYLALMADLLPTPRKFLIWGAVVLGTCAAAAAMNKQHHEKPVVLTSPN